METIRAAIFLVTVLIMIALDSVWPGCWRPDTKEMTRLGRWLRDLSENQQAVVNGLLAAGAGLTMQYYIVDLLIPALTAGPVSATIAIFNLVIGVGIGFSAGKHVINRDYSMFGNPQEDA